MSILTRSLLSSMVDIGHRTGLFAAAAEGPATSEQLAARAGLCERYVRAWFPTFFVTEPVLEAAMPRLYRALRPGGWLVLGRMAPPPDPLAQAVSALRTIRGGGADGVRHRPPGRGGGTAGRRRLRRWPTASC